ncbi:MAG: SUMF1/EgtB/PvdO family nonheme iron enzyme [Chrysiogenales bacterium]
MGITSMKKLLAVGTLFAFSFLVLFSDFGFAQSETPLALAQTLFSQGKYDEALRVLDGYIGEIQAKPEQKPNLAAAWYLLANIYYEVGDDARCDEALFKGFSALPGFDRDESDYGFRERVLKAKARLAGNPAGAETLEQSEEQPQVEEQKKQKELKRIEATRKVEDLKKIEETARAEAKRILEEAQRLERERNALEEQLQQNDAKQFEEQKKTGEPPLAEEIKNQEVQKYSGAMKKAVEVFASKQRHLEAEAARNKKAVSRLAEEPARLIIDMMPMPGESYAIGKYEVTQGYWRVLMGSTPSGFPKGDNYPVENVSWNDVQEFIRKLNAQTGKSYRLPTGAEWEYACRAGTSVDRYGDLDIVAWHNGNSGGATHPVGQKQPNGYGLYDTLGNVWEWCQDLYSLSGSGRMIRGGGWSSIAVLVRSGFRHFFDPGFRGNHLGFRLAMDI